MNSSLKTWEKRKIKATIDKWLFNQLWDAGMPQFRGLVKIKYTRYGRLMDQDNLDASAKYWLDYLTKRSVILDDKLVPAGGHVAEIEFIGKAGKARTILEVFEVDEIETPF